MSSNSCIPMVPERYRTKTTLRSFSIQVNDGHIFYVNPHFLAEYSTVLEKLFFGEFMEGREQKANFPDETVNSMSTLLKFLEPGTKDLTISTIGELRDLIRLADKFDIVALHSYSKEIISLYVAGIRAGIRINSAFILADILKIIIDYGTTDYETLKWRVIDCLTEKPIKNLVAIKLWEKVKDSKLTTAILQTAIKNSDFRNTTLHHMEPFDENVGTLLKPCSVDNCGQLAERYCRKCHKNVCATHYEPPRCAGQQVKEKIDRSLFKSV